MANRNTLHKSKLEDFKKFVESLGYEFGNPILGSHEVARFKIKGHPMGIIFKSKSNVHYSVNEAAHPFVSKYIRSKKND